MNRRVVTLTLSFFLLSSVLPVGAQKNQVVPKTTNPEAEQKAKSKQKEQTGNVLKGWADEVSIIISEQERKAFKGLTKDEERENFIENFWIRRDPTPDTPENEFRDEYYERIDYANDHFTSGISGMRTDRGKMYILNGPPDEIQSHPSGGTYYRPPEEGGGVTTTFPFETWRYRHIDNKGDQLIYEFVDASMSGEYSLQYDPGAKDALRHVPGVGLTADEEANGLDKSGRSSNNLLSGTSAALPSYTQNNEFEMLQRYNDAYKAQDVKYKDILVSPQTRLSASAIPIKVQASYLKLSDDTVRIPITVQILTKDLAFKEQNGFQVAQAHITGVITRIDNRRYPGFSHDVVIDPIPTNVFSQRLDRPNLYQVTTYLAPGKYKLHLTVEDKNSQNIGVMDYVLQPPRIPDQVLQASSLILADSVTDLPAKMLGNEPFAIGDKKVMPNVPGVFRRDQNLHIWQQVYGLTVDQTTHKPSATYELLVTQNKQEVKKVITQSSALANAGQQMNYTNNLPLTDFGPGQYEVQLKVTDNIAKESFVTPGKFTVTASPTK